MTKRITTVCLAVVVLIMALIVLLGRFASVTAVGYFLGSAAACYQRLALFVDHWYTTIACKTPDSLIKNRAMSL